MSNNNKSLKSPLAYRVYYAEVGAGSNQLVDAHQPATARCFHQCSATSVALRDKIM